MQFLTLFPTNIVEICLLFYSVQLGLEKAASRLGRPLIFCNKTTKQQLYIMLSDAHQHHFCIILQEQYLYLHHSTQEFHNQYILA